MKYVLTICTVLCLISNAFAQDSQVKNSFKVGVHAWSRMSLFSNDVTTEEHGMTFSGIPDFGISAFIPISKRYEVGATADISMANYRNTYTSNKVEFTRTFNYLMITPGINFEHLTLSIAIGIPMGYHRHNNAKNVEEEEVWKSVKDSIIVDATGKEIGRIPVTVNTPANGKEGMNLIIEPRLGYSFPVLKTEGSQLLLNTHLGLMMSNVFKDTYYTVSNYQTQNGTMFSFALGVQYLFSL